jgi:hypothetical protein
MKKDLEIIIQKEKLDELERFSLNKRRLSRDSKMAATGRKQKACLLK